MGGIFQLVEKLSIDSAAKPSLGNDSPARGNVRNANKRVMWAIRS